MRLKIIVLVLAIAIVAIALLVTTSAWKPVDGINGAILSLVFPHDTFWAKGYSDKGFQAVQLGMSRDEVYKLLGPPQNTAEYPDGEHTGEIIEGWTCNQDSMPGGNFRRREVTFRGDVVVDKVADFCFR